MTTAVRSLHTKYAGCHFRSRLEARWAVFFERVGIEWEYEPQGFEVTKRVSAWPGGATFNYLPDFWLPKAQVWAEVKGSLTPEETLRVYDAAASLSSNNGAGCHDDEGHDMLLLGPLTKGIRYGNPVRMHMHKGSLIATCFWCADPHGRHVTLAEDSGVADLASAQRLLAGFACRPHSLMYLDEMDAARSARFEFGARG